jgi:hypothetical protein
MTTLIITLHTFALVWWHAGPSGIVAGAVVGGVWTFLVLFIAISAAVHVKPPFYGPTMYWCWMSKEYRIHRIVGENIWLWFALAGSLLYIPLFCWSRGFVEPDEQVWWKFKVKWDKETRRPPVRASVSTALIVAALAYCIPVIATSLARWFLLIHDDLKPFGPSEAQLTVKAIFSLSGILDVLVFLLTRRSLLLFDEETDECTKVSDDVRKGTKGSEDGMGKRDERSSSLT